MTKEEIFALKLKKLRKQNDMTQKELAQKLCVSDKNLSKWECGRSTPDIFYLEEICKIFNVDAEYFFNDEPDCEEVGAMSESESTDFVIWKWIAAILCLSSIALFVAVVARIFVPTTIPAHFNVKGEIDRWGSSREFVFVGLVFSLIGYASFFMKFHKIYDENFNIKELHFTGIILLLIPLFTSVYTVFQSININNLALSEGYLPQSGDTFASLFGAILCFLYIICGAVCMGVRQNGAIGLRIPLTLNNEKAWYYLNRNMGLTLMIVSEIELTVIGLCDLLPVWTVLITPFLPLLLSILILVLTLKIKKKKFE